MPRRSSTIANAPLVSDARKGLIRAVFFSPLLGEIASDVAFRRFSPTSPDGNEAQGVRHYAHGENGREDYRVLGNLHIPLFSQGTSEGPDRPLLQTCLTLSLGLGLLWGWSIYATNSGSSALGFELADSGPFRLASSLTTALALLLLPRMLPSPTPTRPLAAAGIVCAFGSVILLLSLSEFELNVVALGTICGIVAGLAQACMLIVWLHHALRLTFPLLCICVTAASAIMAIYYFLVEAFPPLAGAWIATSLVALSPLTMNRYPSEAGQGATSNLVDSAGARVPLMAFSLALVLGSGFARSLLTANWIPALPSNWVWMLIPEGVIGAFVAAYLQRHLNPRVVFSVIASAVCLAIIAALVLPSTMTILAGAIFGGGWLLYAFGFGAAAWLGANQRGRSLAVASAIAGAISLANGLTCNFILTSESFSGLTSLVAAAVLLVFSLALIVAVPLPNQASQTSAGESDSGEGIVTRCRDLTERYDLTEREYDVLVLLARGNSLKGIAEKLFISENTAKSHRLHIYQKLGINSRQSLIDMIERN